MKSNVLLKVVAVGVVIIIGFVVAKGRNQVAEETVTSEGFDPTAGLSEVETGPMQEDNGLIEEFDFLAEDELEGELGVDVDTPVETMRTLTEETRAVRNESIALQDNNKKLSQKVESLLEMEKTLTQRMENKFHNQKRAAEKAQRETERAQATANKMYQELERRLEMLQETKTKGRASANGYDIGSADIPSGLGYDEEGREVNFDQIVWTNPIDAKIDPKDPLSLTLPDFSGAKDTVHDFARNPTGDKKKEKEARSIKAYTIPMDATLMGSVSMTALVGRIPTNGQVYDPYPFKIIVGGENLSSNGINIPGVQGIKMSGVAKGDWTLSCVSGRINSMTFTFRDGTILTYPAPGTKAKEPIGWFSDVNGIPCVTGERITNAPSYLSQRVALTAAASYANAEAAAQLTSQTNGESTSTSVTGDPKVLAQNTAISSGLNEVTDWLDARQSNSFDAIYVQPGTSLVVHVTDELKIDYDPEGRKVNHYANINRRTDYHID